MQRANIVFLSLGLALAAAIVVLCALPDASPPGLPPAVVPDAPPARGPTPVPMPSTTIALPADAVRVHVAVTSRERFVPPAPARVQAMRAADRAPLPSRLLAGAGAGFDAPATAAGNALVMVEGESGRVLRQVAIGATPADLVLAGPLVVRGKIVGTDQKPVSGAVVWFGEFDHDGQRREFAPDDEGDYIATVTAGDGVPFVVRAPGRASQWRIVVVQGAPGPCDAVLERACTLDVQLVGSARAMHEARLFVVPRSAVSTGLGRWPFFRQAVADGYAIDAEGRASVDDLPAGGEIGLVVRHPEAALAPPLGVVLKGERVRASVPMEFASGSWTGVVVDDAGMPRPGVSVWARPASGELVRGNAQRFVPPHLEAVGTFFVRTDAGGRFTLGAGPAPQARLSLRAHGCAGRDLAIAAVDLAQPILLPTWLGGEPELRVQPPRGGVSWWLETDLGGGLRESVAADTAFRVSLPHAGRFDLVVATFVGSEERGLERLPDVCITGPREVQPKRL